MKLYQDAEKYIKDIFWAETHNKNNDLNIQQIIADKLIEDNKNKDPEYYAHRDGVVHVTSLSKCLRGVVHEMLGAQKDTAPDARKLGVFKAGNLFEDFIVDALGDKMLDRQTEYVYKYKNIILTGRDDGTILHNGVRRILENKSVHSTSFWHREKEGTLVTTQNQQQLQTYLWLRRILPNVFARLHYNDDRTVEEIIYTNLSIEELIEYRNRGEHVINFRVVEKPDNSELTGIFCYISKDDCMISYAPIVFNKNIIDEVVLPAMDLISDGYVAKNPSLIPVPEITRYEESQHQHQVNFICKYCDYHNSCAGSGWLLEANAEVTRKNTELKRAMVNQFAEKKSKPMIAVDTAQVGGDTSATVTAIAKDNGTFEITSVSTQKIDDAIKSVQQAGL